MKIKLATILLVVVCLLSACSNDDNVLKTKSDYMDAVCGYYESEGCYISITEDYYEQKDKNNGEAVIYGDLEFMEVLLLDNGMAECTIYFYRNAYDPITLLIDSHGKITDYDNREFKKIKQKEYDKVETVYVDYSIDIPIDDMTGDYLDDYWDDYIDEIPWYEEEYRTYQVMDDLYQIEILFATGKKDEAIKMIDEKIVDSIDTKVNDLVARREYWVAQNYLAMFQEYLITNRYDYPFTYEYLQTIENVYGKMNYTGIDGITQKYYHIIDEAADNDNKLSKEDALYKMNEYLLDNGQDVVTRLAEQTDYFCYFVDIISDGEAVYYYIYNPYTQEILKMPASYYFVEGKVNIANNPYADFD